MSKFVYSSYPGWGEHAAETVGYSQAVRIGNTIHVSGQGGWYPADPTNLKFPDDLRDEIEQAFKNVELAIQTAGGKGWENVYKVRSYHARWEGDAVGGDTPDVHTGSMVEFYRKYCPGNKPTWTEVGVSRLGIMRMRIEIEVEAFIEG